MTISEFIDLIWSTMSYLAKFEYLTWSFSSCRAREINRPIHASISKTTTPMYTTIRDLLQSIVPDLQGLNAQRYRGNISGGIQEYMEAVLFHHYLERRTLLGFEDAQGRLPEGVLLTYEDYALGVFDMTGELMRFAITYLATNGQLPGVSGGGGGDGDGDGGDGGDGSILADLQLLRSELEQLDASGSYSLNKEFAMKMKTTRASVEKVENGVYSMIVRGKERPKGWRPDLGEDRERQEVESY